MYYSKKYKQEKIKALTTYIKNNHTDDQIVDYLNNKENIKGIDINSGSENEPWLSPLMLCSSRRNTKSMKKLLEMGADVNTTNQFNYTPLMWSATDGNIEAIIFLLEYDAKIDMVNDRNETAVNCAFQDYKEEAFKLLVDNISDAKTIALVEDNFNKNLELIHRRPRVDITPEDYINKNLQYFEKKKNALLFEEKLEKELENKNRLMSKIKI